MPDAALTDAAIGACSIEQVFGWLDDLNPEQRRAVLHDGGHLLIVAGAGSGKTRTLACRVARLLAGGVRPERILLLTFSRRAAREMLTRAAQLAEAEGARRVWGGTFHAVANRLLRQHGAAVGLRSGFTVLDQGDHADLLGLVRHELGLGERGRRFPEEGHAGIHLLAASSTPRRSWPTSSIASYPWCRDDLDGIKAVFAGYVERKRARNVVDYDDLLLYWRALATSPNVGPLLRSGFDHILVDEFQDTNAVQADIVAAMAGPQRVRRGGRRRRAGHLRVPVGLGPAHDRVPRSLRGRHDRHPRPQLPLDATHPGERQRRHARRARRLRKELRPTRPAGNRPSLATCVDELAQSAFVCDSVLEQRERGVPLHAQAVLFRTGHHSDGLELELARRNIPFVKYGGLKFLETAHVKDLLCLLRILENPSDELAWHRVLGLLDGVGPAGTRRLIDELGVAEATALARLLGDDHPRFPAAAAAELEGLRAALGECAAATARPPSRSSDWRPRARRSSPAATPTPRRCGSPTSSISVRSPPTTEAAAASSPSSPSTRPTSTGDLAGPPHLDDDFLVLSTIHSAKGGEWQVVHVIHGRIGDADVGQAVGQQQRPADTGGSGAVACRRARGRRRVAQLAAAGQPAAAEIGRAAGVDAVQGQAQGRLGARASPAARGGGWRRCGRRRPTPPGRRRAGGRRRRRRPA